MEVYLLSLASLQKEEIQQKVVDLLSETDRIGIEEIKSQKKRLTFLGGRILLEYVTHLHGLDTFHLAYGKNGKPYFSDIGDFFFSISHSGDYLILAWSCHEIGVDMEQIRKELPRFPEKMLSPIDFSFWKKQNDLDKIRHFFELWTRKESYTKLHGDSIFRKAQELSVSDGEQFREFMGTPASYFHTCQWDDYMISVSTLEEKAHLSIKIVTLEEIIP